MNTSTVSARTTEGSFASHTVSQKDGNYVLNTATGVGQRKQIIRDIKFLLQFDKQIGSLKSAGKENYLWVPGPHSKESNPIPRVISLETLTRRLNEAQDVYRFEMIHGVLLRVRVLKESIAAK